MSFTPSPTEHLLALNGIRMQLNHVQGRVAPNDPMLDGSHLHQYYEIYCNLTGDVSFLVNNRIYAIRRGDLVMTRPGDVHVCIINRPCLHEHFCLWLDIPRGHPLAETLDRQGEALWCPAEQERERLIDAFFLLRQRLSAMREPGITAGVLGILAAITERQSSVVQPAELPAELQHILDLLNSRFCEFRSISELIAETFVSPATLNRWFRRYVHLSPRTFLEAKKLSCAKMLLQRGCSVSEASEQAGFSDCSYFISVFRRKFGQTPLRYKQSLNRHEDERG